MKTSWMKRISATVLGVGLGLATGAAARAQGYAVGQPMIPGYGPVPYGAGQPYYPYNPYQPQPYPPMPTYPAPAPAYGMGQPMNPYQTAVRSADSAGQATTAVPTSTAAPTTLPPATTTTAAPLTESAPCDLTQAPCDSLNQQCVKCLETVNSASFIGMQGRDDANNRFNIYSNNEALPTNRLWFGYQYEDRFSPGVVTGDPLLQQNRQVSLYRMGGEVMLGCNFSIAFQDEYIGAAGAPDSWGNPDVMLKFAFLNEECRIWSLVLGVQTQAGDSPNELHERTTRFNPGMLFYHSYGSDFIVQGGFQVGVTTDNAPETVDYILSFGYWVYRDPRLDTAGRPIRDCTSNSDSWHWIAGIMPQFELMGTNVWANSRGAAIDTGTDTATFYEDRNVFDLTVGLRVLFTPHVSLAGSWSVPFTHEDNRRSEVLTSLNVTY